MSFKNSNKKTQCDEYIIMIHIYHKGGLIMMKKQFYFGFFGFMGFKSLLYFYTGSLLDLGHIGFFGFFSYFFIAPLVILAVLLYGVLRFS